MLSVIRKRVNYANGAATVALVFAMTGGAFAATNVGHHVAHSAKQKAKHNGYVITSTKQIEPTVLKQLKGTQGPAGSAGAAGANGKDGTNGTNGTSGTSGKDGVSVTSKELAAGNGGGNCEAAGGTEFTSASGAAYACNGTTGYTKTLPEGQSEKGAFAITSGSAGPVEEVAISFNIPLGAAPEHIDVIGENEGEKEGKPSSDITDGECKGTAANPEAAAGNLCLFVTNSSETNIKAVLSIPAGDPLTGAIIATSAMTDGSYERALGSWAVTEAVGV